MESPATPPLETRHADRLSQPSPAEERQAIAQWRRTTSGSDGERITHLDQPDDPVAHKLLDLKQA